MTEENPILDLIRSRPEHEHGFLIAAFLFGCGEMSGGVRMPTDILLAASKISKSACRAVTLALESYA